MVNPESCRENWKPSLWVIRVVSDIKIVSLPGETSRAADALSRLPTTSVGNNDLEDELPVMVET